MGCRVLDAELKKVAVVFLDISIGYLTCIYTTKGNCYPHTMYAQVLGARIFAFTLAINSSRVAVLPAMRLRYFISAPLVTFLERRCASFHLRHSTNASCRLHSSSRARPWGHLPWETCRRPKCPMRQQLSPSLRSLGRGSRRLRVSPLARLTDLLRYKCLLESSSLGRLE